MSPMLPSRTTDVDHLALRELAAGAALDDLDPAERHALDAHLATCAPCRALATDLDDVLGELALVAPALEPPRGMRAAVLAAVREPARPRLTLVAEGGHGGPRAAPVSAIPASRPIPTTGAPTIERLLRWGGLATAAVLAVLAVGLGAQNQRLQDQVTAATLASRDAQAQLQARQAAVTLAADPAHVSVALHAEAVAPAAHAAVIFRPGTSDAYLLATDLPPTPAGHVYQLWYADAAGVHPLGTYPFDGHGPFLAPFGVDLATSVAAMLTLEPDGGATGEPGPQVVFGEL
jgi:hypothetical protein